MHGYAAGTTNRIAEAAEVSIGSLYQYFPNKDAVLRALMQQHFDAGGQRIRAALDDGLPHDLDAALRVVVRATIDNHRGNLRLHRVLFEEAPRAPEFLDQLHRSEDHMVELTATYLRQHPEVRVADHRVCARVVVATIESLVHRLLTAADPVDPDVLEGEIVTLLTGYLRGPGS